MRKIFAPSPSRTTPTIRKGGDAQCRHLCGAASSEISIARPT
jgi:hypothetical protein